MGNLIKGAAVSVALLLLKTFQNRMIRSLKFEVLKLYLKSIDAVRQIGISLLITSCVLLLLAIAFVMIHVGIIILLPFDWIVKGWIILVLGVIYATGSLCFIRYISSEKTWLEALKVSELIAKVTEGK